MNPSSPNYFKAWLFFFLIATVGGFFLGAGIGVILGLLLGFAQIDLRMIKIICGAAGFLIGVPWSYFTFRWVVGEFIVKPLTPPQPTTPASPIPEPPLVLNK